MPLIPIKIPPGFFRNGTQYQVKNRWYSGNLVRFSEGRLRPIGGWQRLAPTQIKKKQGIKSLKITTAGTGYSGAGTLSATGGGGSGFAGTYTLSSDPGGVGTVTITTGGSGYTSAPTITLSGNTSGTAAVITPEVFTDEVDPIRGLHSWRLSTGARYLAVGSTQSLRLWDGSQSSGVNAPIYDITPSSVPSGAINFTSQDDFLIPGLGFGALEYGGDLGVTNFDDSTGSTSGGDVYGSPRYPAVDPDVRDPDAFRDNFSATWSLDSFGDDLLALHSGEGTIWYLDVSTVSFNNATQTATAPIPLQDITNSTSDCPEHSNTAVLVTPERHIMVLGPEGAHTKIQWASQESLTDWNPTLTNTAGDLTLQTKGRIIGGFKTRYGVLIFTTSDTWRTKYLGPPYVYGTERLTEGAGPVGMKCIAGSADFVAWMSRGRFWSYTGGYITELECSVADYIFSDINMDVEGLIAAGHNGDFGEITWFYPKEGDSYNTRYVTYSYREKHWTTGELERSAWEPSDALGFPVAAGVDGYLYRHEMDPDTQSTPVPRESTVTAPANVNALSTMESRVIARGVNKELHPNVESEQHLCHAETGAIEIGNGDQMMSVRQIISDTDTGDNGLRMEVVTGKTPDAPGTTHGPFTLEGDGYSDCRFTDRQTFLKVSSPFDQEWRFGEVRFNAGTAGRR